MTASFLAATAAILWMPGAGWPLMPFIVFGVLAWAPAGPIMSLPAEILDADNRGPGMGIFFSWYYVGMGLLPALAGLTYDMSGMPAAPLYFAAASMAICVPLLGVFRFLKKHASVSLEIST